MNITKIMNQIASCKTIDTKDNLYKDEFLKLHDILRENFPLVHQHLKLTKLGLNLIYELDNKSDVNLLFLAHQDVVPASEDYYKAEEKDGFLYGRGVFDDKFVLFTLLASLEELLRENKKIPSNLFFAFGCDEETRGKKGAVLIEKHFEDRGLKFDFILDEGGVIFQGLIPSSKTQFAVVGLCEKGSANIKITAKGTPGHSSTPSRKTSVDSLCKAIIQMQKKPLPYIMNPVIKNMRKIMVSKVSLLYKLAFGPLFRISSKYSKALMHFSRSTMVTTMLEASKMSNVISESSSAIVNIRIIYGDSLDNIIKIIKKRIKEDVEIEVLNHIQPSKISKIDNRFYESFKKIVEDNASNTYMTPYQMNGATDSTHYSNLSDNIYRIVLAKMDLNEVNKMHSDEERMSLDNFHFAIDLYKKVMLGIS